MAQDKQRPYAELPASPTGRVPQWVRDQAAGKPIDAVPFRAPPSTFAGNQKRRRPRAVLTVSLVVAVVAVLAFANGKRTGSSGSGSLALPRVSSQRQANNGPIRGHEEQSHRLLAASPVPFHGEGASVRFSTHQADQATPVTWSPCRPIHYVIRPDNSPSGGAALINSAIEVVSAATGLAFVNDGATNEAPTEDRQAYQPDRYGRRWAPVLITWATPQEVPDFGVDITGEAGPAGLNTPSGDKTYVSGTVALDARKLTSFISGGRAGLATAVVLHELGHLVGLAHVTEATQVMFPRSSNAVVAYGQGDLAGLAELGRGACQPDV